MFPYLAEFYCDLCKKVVVEIYKLYLTRACMIYFRVLDLDPGILFGSCVRKSLDPHAVLPDYPDLDPRSI